MEDQFIVTLWIAIALGLWAIKLKLNNRKLRKQIAAAAAVAPAPQSAAIAPPADATTKRDPEVERLRERVQVLERITVERENSLARQIEELRDR